MEVEPAADADQPDLNAALAAALQRGVVAPEESGSTWHVDPFVLAWIVAAVEANGDRWLTRYESTGVDGLQVKGWQVRVPAGSPLYTLGLRDGDVVQKVGAADASDVGRVRRTIARVDNRITLVVYRDKFTTTLAYVLEPGMLWDRTRADLVGSDEPPPPRVVTAFRDRAVDDASTELPPSTAGTGKAPPGPTGKPVPGGPTSPSSGGAKPKPPPAGGGAEKVSCSGSTCTVDKAYFDAMVGSPSALQKQATIVPAISNDVHSGYKLKSVKSGGAVDKLGFRSGDKITHVNGYDLTNDAEALALYLGLSSTKKFNVRFVRGGKTASKTIVVK